MSGWEFVPTDTSDVPSLAQTTGLGIPPTLTEFLLARIAEDEADADEFWEGDYMSGRPEPGTWWKWVRDECEAKRRIVELEPDCAFTRFERIAWDDCHETALRALALPYADHADYRQEWRPGHDAIREAALRAIVPEGGYVDGDF